MLEPTPSSERLSFKAWVQDPPSNEALTPEQQQLQHYLALQAAYIQTSTISDAEVEPLVQAVYQRLGISSPLVTSNTASLPSAKPVTWWERLGITQIVAQPMWIASTAMLLMAGLSTALILHYQPGMDGTTTEVALTRSVGTTTIKPENTAAPLYERQVANVEQSANELERNLMAAHFAIKIQDLGQQGKIIRIKAPNAPFAASTQQVLQYHQLETFLTEPNSTIQLHLKPISH